jgi:hypothetical protein
VRSGATVRRFSARPGPAVQRFAVSDVALWPDAVAAKLEGTPVGQAAPLPEAAQGGQWQEAAQDGPWLQAADGLWPEAAQDGP